MTDDKKLTLKEHSVRALSAGSQGVRDAVLPATAGLGLLALRPYFRNIIKDTKHVPKELKTDTQEKLVALADKLVRAGGRNPDKGRLVEIKFEKQPGFSAYTRELKKAPGATRASDVLRLGLNVTPESVAHEAGHLTHGNRFGKALSAISPILRTNPAKAVPALLAATALFGDPEKDTPMIAKAAPYVGAAQLATILGEEVRANRRATKLLKRIGYKSPLKQRVGRHLMPLAYLPWAAGLIAAPLGILAGTKAYNEARKKKRPMPVTGILSVGPKELANAPSAEELREKWAPYFK